MIGWAIFAGFALVAWALLWRVGRLDKGTLTLAVSALFVAAAGYAWLGSPGEAGAPAALAERPMRADTLFANERQQFLGKFGETGTVLATADAFNRMGEDETAVDLIGAAIRKRPRDVDLRIGYAHALLVLAHGTMTPAVELAYQRAGQMAPANPAPRYFYGLAHVETGDLAGAEQIWKALCASLPPASPWRAPLAKRLAVFSLMQARPAGAAERP